jgi:murein DD-endopeptidase MepM/ murein hydrolase activator NlpD
MRTIMVLCLLLFGCPVLSAGAYFESVTNASRFEVSAGLRDRMFDETSDRAIAFWAFGLKRDWDAIRSVTLFSGSRTLLTDIDVKRNLFMTDQPDRIGYFLQYVLKDTNDLKDPVRFVFGLSQGELVYDGFNLRTVPGRPFVPELEKNRMMKIGKRGLTIRGIETSSDCSLQIYEEVSDRLMQEYPITGPKLQIDTTSLPQGKYLFSFSKKDPANDRNLSSREYSVLLRTGDGPNAGSFSLAFPISGMWTFGRMFGQSASPANGRFFHPGVDIEALPGTDVHAAADGKVISAGWDGGYGFAIRLSHADGYETLYAHLMTFAADIQPGITVRTGDVIGYVGSTGKSTGYHLHFGVTRNQTNIDPLDLLVFPKKD